MKRLLLLSLALWIPGCASQKSVDGGAFSALGVTKSFAPQGAGVLCSGQPTTDQFDQLASAGVERVICLRPGDEPGTGWEEGRAAAAGLEFVRLAVAGGDDLTEEKAKELAAMLQDGKPTLVACGSSNRVGGLLALKAYFVDGKSKEEALQFGRECGMTRAEGAVRKAMEK
jgi:protein tyrosine phosphatase (PTP) superfamily phosphohydrolase (DUF442 family)